jgi:hypothetical protein
MAQSTEPEDEPIRDDDPDAELDALLRRMAHAPARPIHPEMVRRDRLAAVIDEGGAGTAEETADTRVVR